jgi:hypothetical protein
MLRFVELLGDGGALPEGAAGLGGCEGEGERAGGAAAGGGEPGLSGTAALVGGFATCGCGKRDMRAINLRHWAALNAGVGCIAPGPVEPTTGPSAGAVSRLLGVRGAGPRGRVADCRLAGANAMSRRPPEPGSIGAPAAACKPAGATIRCGLTVRGSASSRRIASARSEPGP